MSLNGLGQFIVNSTGNPTVSGTTISTSWANALTADLATALSTAVYKDGQQTLTANIPFGGFKATGLAVATIIGDALSYGRAATVSTLSATGAVTFSGALAGTAITTTGTILSGNSSLRVGASTSLTSGAVNFLLDTVVVLSGYLSFLTWNSGLGFALAFIDASGNIYTISSSNAAGGNSAFDTTNNFASNGANGVALIANGGNVFVQTKTNYSGPTPSHLAQFG